MKTFIATSAFMGDTHGDQCSMVARTAHAGADGIEIREELFTSGPRDEDLQSLRECCLEHHLELHYSSSEPVWNTDASLNAKIYDVLYRATQLGARLVKLRMGEAPLEKVEEETLRQLEDMTNQYSSIQITIENDQTQTGGAVSRMEAFLSLCKARTIPIGLTFDLGNWAWVGEDPIQAAVRLRDYVNYIHVKSADTSTVPPQSTQMDFESGRDERLIQTLAILPNSCPRCIEYSLTDCSEGLIRNHVLQLRNFQKELSI